MLLTITTTRAPATDLGYLLHKHPDRPQSFAVSAGTAHVFYPEATPERCTAALLLEVDPIALVRGPAGKTGSTGTTGKNTRHSDGELAQYVNDRPYAAASMLAVAIKEAFRTALTGRCDARPELAAERIPLALRIPALRCRGGETLAHRVFAPLGWSLDARSQPLRPPEWGDSPYLDLRLTGELRLADALNHLYVLLPVLDDAKHYWVSTEEVDKLIRAGGDWLRRPPGEGAHHPPLPVAPEETHPVRAGPAGRSGRHRTSSPTTRSPAVCSPASTTGPRRRRRAASSWARLEPATRSAIGTSASLTRSIHCADFPTRPA